VFEKKYGQLRYLFALMVKSEKRLIGTFLRDPIFACKGSSRKDEVLETNRLILLLTSKLITGVNNET
jgi:hypothetical protein